MYVEGNPYAVPCAMTVGESSIPKGFACQNIKLIATGPFGELCCSNGDMTFEYKRVVYFEIGLRFCLAKGNGTGNVGRTVFVLSPAIEEQYAFVAEGVGTLGSSSVVYNGTVILVPTDGIEAIPDVHIALGAMLGKDAIDLNFCWSFSSFEGSL